MERAMANVATNNQAGENELSELISRLRRVAEAMRSLSGDQPGLRERLKKLSDEVYSVSSRLRRFS
jgi:predicted nuclease with TOPRIM domain